MSAEIAAIDDLLFDRKICRVIRELGERAMIELSESTAAAFRAALGSKAALMNISRGSIRQCSKATGADCLVRLRPLLAVDNDGASGTS